MPNSPNLWPDLNFAKISPPKSIFEEQAYYLTESTKKAIIATVRTVKSVEENKVDQDFHIVVPGLDNYKYLMFYYTQDPLFFYPGKITFENENYVISNEEELLAKLKGIFSHEVTVRILSTILSQVSPSEKEGKEQ